MQAVNMNVVLIPFFLAARLVINSHWEHGPEYTFQVVVNSTAVPEEDIYWSVRLNLESKLICQPKLENILSCHFEGSKASSFVSESRDPDIPAQPISPVTRQLAYEISQEQFELKFDESGLASLILSENVQPRELDMIRVIVGHLHAGGVLDNRTERTFEQMDNFTQGECATRFVLDRRSGWTPYERRPYTLHTAYRLKNDQILQIRKIRNLYACTHQVPYFFGSVESFRDISNIVTTVASSETHITISPTEFISGSWNVITTGRPDDPVLTTLHENISVRLVSIKAATNDPPEVQNPEQAGIFIGRWFMDDSSEEEREDSN